MLYVKNGIPFTFGHISTSIMRVDRALHVALHMNAVKLIISKFRFNVAQVVQCLFNFMKQS